MKKLIQLLLTTTLFCAMLLCLSGCGGSDALTLNVYNWGGDYIANGSEGSFDSIAGFEDWYEETYGEKVKVNYDTYTSNEDMYAKISTGAVSYDVIVPSDYMIERLRNEDALLPLDFDNIPNYENVDDNFHNLYYDPEDQYSVPYTYGIVGVIYDANKVDKADATGWDLLWNKKYAGSILQFNNPRDAFGTAMYRLGNDVNTTDHAQWDQAADALMEQKPLRYGLVMDEIFNLMESGEAAIGVYYAGDYFLMRDNQAKNVDLQFYYPEPTNYFIDAMCIPKSCKNKELAEAFINYMLSEEPAVANAITISYAAPNKVVYNSEEYIDAMGKDVVEILYPDFENFAELYNKYAFRDLDTETLDYINTLWEKIKIN